VVTSHNFTCFYKWTFILSSKIFIIRHFLTRIPLPSRPITSSKSLILQHAFAYQSQTSCMDLVNQWRFKKIQEIQLCAYNTHPYMPEYNNWVRHP
jgi:hypothetical protein